MIGSMMKKGKTAIALLIVSVFLVTSFYGMDPVYAAKKSGISFTNINSNFVLKKGKKYKIRYVKSGKAAKRKVKFKSSNKRIATVSKKGVIKGKRNGTVKITAYVIIKGKKRYKKTVRIRIGNRVSRIKISGYDRVRVGDTVSLTKSISPSSAKNKNVSWSSSDKTVAKVSQSGKVTGLKEGDVVITAKAKDGSKVEARYKMHVFRFQKNETNWVAHRGVHIDEVENTRAAFEAAGLSNGFWGCEADIHETKHVLTDPEDPLSESFDLVINHDNTFKRVFGVNRKVADMTTQEIVSDPRLSGKVCFFEDFLQVCMDYDMVPVVELKMRDSENDEKMSPEAVMKAVDTAYNIGGSEFLESIDWISFYANTLVILQDYLAREYGVTQPKITYLISGSCTTSDVFKKVEIARRNGFSNIAINKNLLSDAVADECRDNGIAIGAWTYENSIKDKYKLYMDMRSHDYDLENMTVDYIPW